MQSLMRHLESGNRLSVDCIHVIACRFLFALRDNEIIISWLFRYRVSRREARYSSYCTPSFYGEFDCPEDKLTAGLRYLVQFHFDCIQI